MSDEFSWADEVDERIRLAVAGGYDDEDRIVEDVTELIVYDPAAADYVASIGGDFADHAAQKVTAALAAHAAAEAEFPTVTDPDRITQVFAELTARGIIAWEDVGMTMGDVRDDMWQAISDEQAAGHEPRGWVAFHRQDVDRAVESGVLCIAFAAATDLDEDFVVIAREAAEALDASGLRVMWDGTANRRIELVGLTWQRRRNGG